MARQQHTNDSGLWVALLREVCRLFPFAAVGEQETEARRLVAAVRRSRGEDQTWAPGDTIPADVSAVYDVDGDEWIRGDDSLWTMPGFNPETTEAAAGEPQDDATLLREYGPASAIPEGGITRGQ